MTYIERADTYMRSLGLDAYRVGGSVRDEILGRRPKDADYMVRRLDLTMLGYRLRKSNPKPLKLRDGRQAGWRVQIGGHPLEIMLPRTEVSTGPGHRDFMIVVDPALSLDEDARRRDFTFNTLYRRLSDGKVIDPTERGLFDLERRIIHTTHSDSFRDDPLRTLRALRFVSRGFDLSSDAYNEMVKHADAVDGLTANGYASGTVFDELSKILMGQRPQLALRTARDTGVLAVVLPELADMLGFDQRSRYHDLTTDEHTFKALETAVTADASLRVRLALLFHDSGKPDSAWADENGHLHYYAKPDGTTEDHEVVSERLWRAAGARLNVPVKLREDVATLIRLHMLSVTGKPKPSKINRMRVQLGDDLLSDLYLHRACDISAKGSPNLKHLQQIGAMEAARKAAAANGVPASVRELAVNGEDAKRFGLSGRQIGEALRTILDEVVVEPDERRRSREWQLSRLEALA